MRFDEFSTENRRRCEHPKGFNHALTSWSLSDWFTAVVGELGEAANVAKKLNRVRDCIPGNDETVSGLQTKLRSELADAYIYLDLLAQSQGIDIGAAVRETFDRKSEKIGYLVSASTANDEPPPVDRPKLCTTDGRSPAEARASQTNKTGQHPSYIVLCDEERAKGFVRPYRDRYKHTTCGGVTTMGRALSETYARDPAFYGATFCCTCNAHYPVAEFVWTADGQAVGS